jgi:hypothetical protein
MGLLIALFTLAFVHPGVQPAAPGLQQPEGNYVVSPEGVFRIEKGKVQRAPKKFHPAFVFSSDDKFRVAQKLVEPGGVTIVPAGDKIVVRYSDGFVVRKSQPRISGSREVDSAYAIQVAPAADEYLLVRWAGCEAGFTLFKADNDTIVEVARNNDDCSRR